jgi:hypothetical protein
METDDKVIEMAPRVAADDVELAERAVRQVGRAPAVVVDDDGGGADEAARKRAFGAEFSWRGRALNAFSVGRESLFYELRLAVGAPPLEQTLRDVTGFLGDAVRILWLCAHRPEDWRHLRGAPLLMQEEIDAWADENVRGTAEAALTGLRIFNSAGMNVHEPVLNERGNSDDLGN